MRYEKIALLLLSLALVAPLPVSGSSSDVSSRILEITRRINKDRNNPRLYAERAALHRIKRDWPAAITDYGRVESLNPMYPRLDVLRAETWLEAGRPDAARPLLERHLFDHPADTEALIIRARALALLASPAAAAADLDRVIAQLDPAPPELYVSRATYRTRTEESCPKGAVGGLDEAMEKMGPAEVLVEAAIELELECGRWQAALAQLEKLPNDVRSHARWLVRRAEVLEVGQQREAARRTYVRARQQLESLNANNQAREENVALARRINAALGN